MVTSRLPRRLDPLAHLIERAHVFAPTAGHFPLHDPDLCFYRFDRPTAFAKAATFGITAGIVLRGNKRVELGDHALDVAQGQLLVVTRDTDLRGEAFATPDRAPYVGMSLLFTPDRVARAGEVAAQVGFESAAHFAREFKRRYGHPPTHVMRPLAK